MNVQKGERFKTAYSEKVNVIAGKWDSDYILMPLEEEDDECMIYSASEINELLENGRFTREWR